MATRNGLGLLLALMLPAMAMADDSGAALEVGASHKLCKGLEASIDAEVRTQDGLGDMERWSIGAALEYKFCKWLKADAGYTFIDRYIPAQVNSKGTKRTDDYWSPRHRAFVSATGIWKPNKHWELSLRERYQYTYETKVNVPCYRLATGKRDDDKVKGDEGESLLRSRLQVKWTIRKKCPWTPFANVEALNDLGDGFSLDQMRYTIGTGYKINKHNSLGLSYRYKDKSNSDEAGGHLITLSYTYDF